MKKLTALILALVMAFSLVACGSDKEEEFRDIPESQVTTEEKQDAPAETEKDEEPQPTPQPTPTTEPVKTSEPEKQQTGGIRPEFKKAMDDYEAFFDKYIEFMERYETASTTELMGLMTEYLEYMTEFTQAMEAMDAMEDEEMSTEEALYYAQVTTRISQKLMAVA